MSIISSLSAASLSLDPVSDFRQLTAFPFMVNALEAGTVVAILAGVAGWFMVLRRESFAGHTLSVMAFPGATGAVLIGLPAAAGYFTFCGVSALVIGSSAGSGTRRHRGEESAVTGAVQAFGLACGFLFLSLYQGVLAGYENVLFGDFLGITRGQVLLLTIVAVLTAGLLRGRRAPAAVRVRRRRRRPSQRRARPRACRCCSCSSSVLRSRRPRRSPGCCWCSRCSSLLPRPRS